MSERADLGFHVLGHREMVIRSVGPDRALAEVRTGLVRTQAERETVNQEAAIVTLVRGHHA